MMPPQLVSVVIPTHNSARTLEACLTSITDQTYRHIELLVVDNGSTDESLSIAGRCADHVINHGPERSAQRNRGAQSTNGVYLLFVDSDMTLAPRVIEDCVTLARETAAPAVVIPEISIGRGFLARCRALERSCYVGDDDIEAARFITRIAFDSAGGFDESLTGPEDWDLSMRVRGGRRLPRTSSSITHDEGRLELGTVLTKKRYYAASALLYWRKHPSKGLRQANLVFRPAFFRNWRRLVRHPILSSGVVLLKILEMTAAGVGVVEALVVARSSTSIRARD